ncbi:C4-dicarboxylate transporter DctM subunit [Bacillus thermophilus]|uniref:C4-dicarboxylate transporter DctM subunit n=1 Tax=Siminovitchia thermophila TaxID=1245522 RepID=A0ABS2RCT7_9BACI|nr:TRAP transporter large permease [Siminovitchia thermophila]MBM7717471.1 C4-dicarboxylate transporter DctM subunit [Siminovitchia thermophila]ONK22324.1 C4-dicarboxylate ABC transporter permease [Bacillus sp. VT-16-64]
MAAILFGLFLVLLILGVPIGFVLALSSVGAMFSADYPLVILSQRLFTALDSFPFMAIPLFMLAGSIMSHGGITKRIVDFALSIFGNIKGALAHVVATSGIMMGGISGSGVADTAALGAVMVPEMKKRKYDAGFSAALVAASGSIGLIIPPSIALIIYGVTTQSSIGDLFVAGIIPGVAIGVGFFIYSYFVARKKDYPKEGKVSAKGVWTSFKKAVWSLLMPVIIILGIRGGVFTATEGGAIISVYAFFISAFIYKEIKLKDIPKIFYDAALSTAVISTIIASTSLFGWLLSSEQIPQKITAFLLGITDNPILLLLIINLLLLIVGMFLDSGPAIMLLAPILAPVAQSLGVDMVQFGIIMVINLTIGLLTPPVGTSMYVASNVSGVPIMRLAKKLMPFWLIMITVLLLITFIPGITTMVIQ